MSVVDDISLSKFLELLSSPRRRFVLGVLEATEGHVSIDALAARLADWERADSPADVTAPDESQIKASLYHTHLPKLANAGLVTYDSTEAGYDVDEPTPTDVSLDRLLAEERDRMLAHCC